MPKLPRDLSGRDVMQALQRNGFVFVRRRSTHCLFGKGRISVLVPDHATVKPGTLRDIIRDAGLTVDEFLRLL